MIRSVSRALLLALTLAALVAGCGTPTSPTQTTTTTTVTTSTTTTSYVTKTETETGAVGAGGRVTVPTGGFDATPGVITVTMTALDPSTLLPAIGMGIGTFDVASSTCTIVVQKTAVVVNTQVVATASIPTTAALKFCVQVWDVNGFGTGYVQNFTLTIAHQALAGT